MNIEKDILDDEICELDALESALVTARKEGLDRVKIARLLLADIEKGIVRL